MTVKIGILSELLNSIVNEHIEVIDLSQVLNEHTPVIPLPEPNANSGGFKFRQLSKYNETGQECYWNDFIAGEHVGTHIDAPVHWFTGKNKDSVDQIPMKNMIGEAYVI